MSTDSFIRVHLAVVLVAIAVAVSVVVLPASIIDSQSRQSAREWEAALSASRAEARLGDLLSVLSVRIGTFLESPEVTSLDAETAAVVSAELLRPAADPSSPSVASLLIPLALSDAVAFQQSVAVLRDESAILIASLPDPAERAFFEAQAAATSAAIESYFTEPTISNFRLLMARLDLGRRQALDAVPALQLAAVEGQEDVLGTTHLARIVVIAVAIVAGASVLIVTLFLGRRFRRAFSQATAEKSALEAATASLQHRNDQLNALYSVFAEVTDTLSLRYVVEATLREGVKLVDADFGVVRLVRDGDLIVAGSLNDQGEEVAGLDTVRLGEGLVGRAAKRGRTIRINEDAESAMIEGQQIEGMQSGVIVPLIVGARVVGTLGFWSRAKNAFGPDEERILEMMASQVAVAAVDLTEMSERRAHHDTLTGLPNRLQLSEDIAGVLNRLYTAERRAVIAMVDIDNFKRFNDDFGHRVGDVTLQKVASVLNNSVRSNDLVYRYGGEEFVVVYVDAAAEEAVRLAERVREAVASTPLTGDKLEPVGPITVSIGLSLLPQHGSDLDALIDLADRAMYQSKDVGRNLVTLWGDAPTSAAAA